MEVSVRIEVPEALLAVLGRIATALETRGTDPSQDVEARLSGHDEKQEQGSPGGNSLAETRDALGAAAAATEPEVPCLDVSSLNLPPEVPEKVAPAAFLDEPAEAIGPSADSGMHFSDARIQEMVNLRARGVVWPKVWEALNAMPGLKIKSSDSCVTKFFTLRRLGRLPAPGLKQGAVVEGDASTVPLAAVEGDASTVPLAAVEGDASTVPLAAVEGPQVVDAGLRRHDAEATPPKVEVSAPVERALPARKGVEAAPKVAALTERLAAAPLSSAPAPLAPWSEERVKKLVEMRAAKERWPVVAQAMNALPGPRVTEAAVIAKYAAMERAGTLPQVKPPPSPAGVVKATETQIRHWAIQQKLPNRARLDLDAVNAKRAEMGLAVFELREMARVEL